MSIAAQVKAANTAHLCKFGRVLAELDDNDRDAIQVGLDTGVTNVGLARILTANGYTISEKAVRIHRTGTDCRCGRDA